jgi:hypothetical protein
MIVRPAAAGFLVRLSSLRDGHGKFLSSNNLRPISSATQRRFGLTETKHFTVFAAEVQGLEFVFGGR